MSLILYFNPEKILKTRPPMRMCKATDDSVGIKVLKKTSFTLVNARVAWPIALLIAIFLSGCKSETSSAKTPTPAAIELISGTPIKLLLAQALSAGSTREGSQVRFLVAKDVVVDNRVVIAKGAEAIGTVSWSRSEGSLSSVMNRPARLAVKLESVKAVDGSTVPLSTKIQFDRNNTSAAANVNVSDQLWSDSAKREILTKIAQDLAEGRTPDVSGATEKEALASALQDLGLNDAKKLLNDDKATFEGLLSTLAGSAVQPLGQVDLALHAVKQLGGLVEGVGTRLGGIFKGRTIRAPIGMEITAKTETKATVKA